MSGVKIALDAMGGDSGPETVIAGIARAHHRWPDARFVAYGDEARVRPCLEQHPELESCVEFVHTADVIGDEDKPMQAVRRGQNSSMGLAIQAVKKGHVQVAVSAGNTGALMALSKIMLRTMEGIDRPALATLIPTVKGESVMLDLGANVEASEENLVQFAVMGAAYARAVLGLERPRVGLLNVGVEELKGHSIVKNAGAILRNTDLAMEFAGYVEGNGLSSGEVDVIVTDGFTGNVAIKTAEGTVKLIRSLLRDELIKSWVNKIAYLMVKGSLKSLGKHLDPNNHNGGVFLGLNGLIVKSHGNASDKGIATAIGVAIDMARNDLTTLIAEDLRNSGEIEKTIEKENTTETKTAAASE